MVDGSLLRVALLARAGDAREQLRRAIAELGTEIVVELDPNDLRAGTLSAVGVTTVLISVEPAVEAALDRIEDELLAPGLVVIFDEAETTAKLSGWDQARWARHLAAKLLGCDVLPPGTEPAAHQEAADHLVPSVLVTPAALANDARIDDFVTEGHASAADVPSAYRPSDAVIKTVNTEFDESQADVYENLVMDADLARLAAAFDQRLDAGGFKPVSHVEVDESENESATPTKPHFNFPTLDGLSLAPLDGAPLPVTPSAPAIRTPPVPTPALDTDYLSLTPITDGDGNVAEARGVVLVLSGMGGPDAVRQLLRALPTAFPLAVLLQQQLDGGRHDRFVEQLAKISRLPVALAESHETPPAGAVRVLLEGLDNAGALSFPREGGIAALIAAVTVREGAVVVLSGADVAVIEPLKQALSAGFRVLVQEPSSCFDAEVAEALQAAGAPSLPASHLALRLDAYFPA